MAKVYIVSNNGFDFDPAKEFGELVFLTTGYVNVHENFEDYKKKFVNILKEFQPQTDYLLLVGVNLLNVLAYSAIREVDNVQPIKVLQWNANQNKYVEYTL